MIKLDKVSVMNMENAIRGARNPMNSWERSDSYWEVHETLGTFYYLGANDLGLAKRLCKAGSDHRKFLRQIFVSVDITAPLYFWKEYDTYKVGTTANSTSTMHFAHKRDFVMSDFSFDLAEEKTKTEELQKDVEIIVKKEIWKDIKGYEGVYKISNTGHIMKLPTETVKTDGNISKYKERSVGIAINSSGYKKCILRKNKEAKNFYLHRLMAETFIDNEHKFPVVNHKDGNKLNNNIENLEWVTYSENDKHAVSIGVKGVSNYNKLMVSKSARRFSDEEVLKMFDMYENGMSKQAIADAFECYSSTVCNILNGKTYNKIEIDPLSAFKLIIKKLNELRRMYVLTGDKCYWYAMIQLLPSSYNQLRTCTLTYENLINMYHARKNHKLDEWVQFTEWIKSLPYSEELIIGE